MEKHRSFRIMCIGDGTVFGPKGEKTPWPHVVQNLLSLKRSKLPIEVINAGVPGHSTVNMMFRIRRLMRFYPDAVVLCPGWNDMWNEAIDTYIDHRRFYGTFWQYALRKPSFFRVATKARELAGITERQPLPISFTADEFVPFNYEYHLLHLLRVIGSHRAKACIVSPPRLVQDSPAQLSEQAASMADVPDYIEDGDYSTFLKVSHSYERITAQIAEELGVARFDAQAHFDSADSPREALFEDQRHLTPEGNLELGAFIANQLKEQEIVV